MHYTHEGSTEEENTSSLNERSSDQLGNRAVGGGGFIPPSSHNPFESTAEPVFVNPLKVHKIEIFFGFDFEICIFSVLVM
jgi:hypothetical protein